MLNLKLRDKKIICWGNRPIVIAALGAVPKGLEQGLEDLEITGEVKTIKTTVLLRSVRILRRVQET